MASGVIKQQNTIYPSNEPRIRKNGKNVVFNLTDGSIADIISYTVPAEYRPNLVVRGACVVRNTSYSNTQLGMIEITSTGSITVKQVQIGGGMSIMTEGYVEGTVTWNMM